MAAGEGNREALLPKYGRNIPDIIDLVKYYQYPSMVQSEAKGEIKIANKTKGKEFIYLANL